jgi:hypothetical protein
MKPSIAAAILIGAVMFGSLGAETGDAQGGASPEVPTFSRDVAPVLYSHCVSCHRPGEAAPMSLLTYADARPWAGAIGRQVADGIMPPWHADAPPGTFENERRLTAAEKDVIARWIAGGSPQGDPADLPSRPSFTDGWRIGQPDSVFEMQEAYAVPAAGTIAYEYFYIPTNFTDSKWLQAIEVRPGNRALVHHVLVYYAAPPDNARGAQVLRPNRDDNRFPPTERNGNRPQQRLPGQKQLIATYAPGTDPQVFRAGTALKLAPGGTIELQLHYTANGTAGTDRTRVGMVFAKQPPAHEIRAAQFVNAIFTIPAGAEDHEVSTDVEFLQDATLWGLFPHTHVRGKRWSYSLTLPDGTKRTLLSVPKYDFNWQTYYMFSEPIQVPRGARIVSTAWYDNSVRNRSNPDPTMPVRWGDQTWEEMQYTGVLYSPR